MAEVKFSSLAQKDLEDSAEWYEEQNPGLGDRFAEFIYSAVVSISNSPEVYPIRKAKIREFSADKFPYIVIYQYVQKEDVVRILRIFHTSRNPKLKYKRK